MFKDKIRDLRVNNGMSLTQMAEAIGVSKSTVSLYESGKQNPGKATVARICDAFEVSEEWLFKEDETASAPKNKAAAAGKHTGTKKVNTPPKKETVSNAKGENKMSKKSINRIVPPMPFPPYRKAAGKEEEDGDRKAKAEEMKENYKELLKKYHEENTEARKDSAQNRKDKRDQAFDRFMEVQETFAGFMSEDSFVLPFAPMYSIFPKKIMKQFMEFERMSNEYLKKQADIYEDFRKQRKEMFRDMWTASVVKNEKKEEAEETA